MNTQAMRIRLPTSLGSGIKSSFVDEKFLSQYDGTKYISLDTVLPVDKQEFVKRSASYVGLSYPEHRDECRLTKVDSSLTQKGFQWTEVPVGTTAIQFEGQVVGLPHVQGG
jgi:hypothetical protein